MSVEEFTAPFSGIYLFSLTANTADSEHHRETDTKINIWKNDMFFFHLISDLSKDFNKNINWNWMDDMIKGDKIHFEVEGPFRGMPVIPFMFTAEYTDYTNNAGAVPQP